MKKSDLLELLEKEPNTYFIAYDKITGHRALRRFKEDGSWDFSFYENIEKEIWDELIKKMEKFNNGIYSSISTYKMVTI